ncbi:hypothetical protein JBL43_14050 [Aureibaculum sp. A20]|uniref:Uncharacterized protein n=1 Tax=Aureibaculum flavum TaxID=2795986 RepID=A0ABS0WTS7_9FLAO|nr:DUF6452 family protein [Aureibaculum flavum]MBJ2175372.1 hypothetical protein [Aureibaculum flavum]
MRKNITILFLIISTIVMLNSCERDEVCIDPITPNLIVVFYDFDDSENEKSVNNLAIEIIDIDGIGKSLDTVQIDSVGIPLNVYDNQTKIVLTANSKDDLLFNRDTILVSYTTEEVFVGRSCGYKSIFNNVTISRNFNDSDKWIKSLLLSQTEIEDETEAHVTILH